MGRSSVPKDQEGHSPVRVHKGTVLLAGVAALALALSACSSSGGSKPSSTSGSKSAGGGSTSAAATSGATSTGGTGTGAYATCNTAPNTCNTGTPKAGGTVTYVLEKTIPGWNVNTANSAVFELAEVEDGVLPAVYNAGPDLKPFLNTDLVTSANQTTTGGVQTITYNINPKAVWSDGSPIDYADFVYNWKVNSPTYCPNCGAASTAGYVNIKKMVSSNGGKTVTVTMATPFSDWESMFGSMLPEHIAALHGSVTTPKGLAASFTWFDKNQPKYSGGPYLITGYTAGTSVTETPNPKWYGAVKPTVQSVIFRIITDQTQEVPALQNHEVDSIYPQPNLAIVQAAKQLQGVSTDLSTGLVWEHLDLNEANQFLKDLSLRKAIFQAVNVKAIIARTVGQFAPQIQPLGNHMYLPGQPGYVNNLTGTGQGSGNIASAKQILTAAKYTGVGSTLKTPAGKAVTLRCLYTAGNTLRQSECQIIQSELDQLGIKVSFQTSTDLHELGSGDFDMAIFAWQGTPYVVAGAQQIWELKGGGDYGKNVDPAEEKLINEAAVSTDPATTIKLMNEADVKLTADNYVLPLYPKPSFIATSNNVVNVRNNATSVGPPYNVQAWGLKS
jgi:peptide/nickel transport system substrate-binding protein